MKKLISFSTGVIFLLAFSLVSCEKEPSELIVGTWEATSEEYTSYEDGVKTDEFNYDFENDELVIKILDDGTAKVYEDGTLEDTYEWDVDGDVLTLTYEDETEDFEFTVSEDNLTLLMEDEYEYDGVVYRETSEIHLKRQ